MKSKCAAVRRPAAGRLLQPPSTTECRDGRFRATDHCIDRPGLLPSLRWMMEMSLERAAMQLKSGRTATAWADRSCILTINGGSSSLKFALFAMADRPARLLSGRVERIGMPSSQLMIADAEGRQESSAVEAPDLAAAVELLIQL